MKYSSLNLNTDDTFNEFLRIAQDKKIFKVIEEGNEHDVKDGKSLYDVSVSDDKTGKELIEIAHPDKAETIPSYTTDGGLVENQTEQQENDIFVALNPPSNIIYKKNLSAKALKDLSDELIIIAEEMDVRGNHEISCFADNILNRLDKKAQDPITLLSIGAIAAVVGGLYYLAVGTDPINLGVDKNIQSLIIAINEYKENNPQLQESSVDVLSELNNILVGLVKTRQQYKTLNSSLESKLKETASVPTSKEELKNIKVHTFSSMYENKDIKSIINDINKYGGIYNQYVFSLLPELKRILNYLTLYFKKTEDIAKTDTAERSTLTQFVEKTKEFFGKIAPVRSSEKNVLDALSILISSLDDDVKLRTAEKEQLISMLVPKIKYDISEQFNLPQ